MQKKTGQIQQKPKYQISFTQPFIQKYRPKYLLDMVGNLQARTQLRKMCLRGGLPNLLFTGPPGCGKTTSAIAIINEMIRQANGQIDEDKQKPSFDVTDFVLQLNASDDRGIDVVRIKIKQFASKKVVMPGGGCFPKIVLLDEADSLTTTAQHALRVIITDYSDQTRFVLSCNDSTKLIEPIQSRLTIIRFSKINDQDIVDGLMKVIVKEKIQYNDDGIQALVYTANGDMRYALNNLQAVFSGAGFVSQDSVFKICDVPRPQTMQRILMSCEQGDIEQACKDVDQLWMEGYNAGEIIGGVQKVLMSDGRLKDVRKVGFLQAIGEYKMKVIAGSQKSIVMVYGFLAQMCKVGMNKDESLSGFLK